MPRTTKRCTTRSSGCGSQGGHQGRRWQAAALAGTPGPVGTAGFSPRLKPCSLAQEYLLHLLLQPRRRYSDFAEEEEECFDDLGSEGGEGGEMHRSKSGEPWGLAGGGVGRWEGLWGHDCWKQRSVTTCTAADVELEGGGCWLCGAKVQPSASNPPSCLPSPPCPASPWRPGAPPADARVHPASPVPAQHEPRAEQAGGGGGAGGAFAPLVQGAGEAEGGLGLMLCLLGQATVSPCCVMPRCLTGMAIKTSCPEGQLLLPHPTFPQVMFWRRSKAELQPIEEAEEKEGPAEPLELHTLGSGSTVDGLPSGAVVVDVEGGGRTTTTGGSVGGSGPSRVPSIAADIPLLEHSPPSIAIKPPPHKRTPPPSPSPAATPVARPGGLASQQSLPTGKPPLPAPSPRQPSKLERLRSLALEAARDEVLGKPGQGHSGGTRRSDAPSIGRRLSGESERAATMRRPSLPREWSNLDGTVHGPGSTVHGGVGGTLHGGAGGTVHGSGSVGGTMRAGTAFGMASREAIAAGGATARVTFARAAPLKRSTSLQSHKSLAAGKAAALAAPPAPVVDPVATKASRACCCQYPVVGVGWMDGRGTWRLADLQPCTVAVGWPVHTASAPPE